MDKDVVVNVDARPSRPSWLWKFTALALLALVAVELVAIEKHLRVIAEAQMLQALQAPSLPPAPAAPSTEPRLGHGTDLQIAEVIR